MNFLDFMLPSGSAVVWLSVLDTVLKVTFLLAIAGAATVALSRASAAVRHHVWALALLSALALPVLAIALPRWQLALVQLAPESVAAIPSEASPADVAAAPPIRRETSRLNREPSPAAVNATVGTGISAPASSSIPAWPRMSPAMWLTTIWAIGVAIVLGRLLLGIAAVQLMSRRTGRVIDAPWLPLALELAREIGISRRLTFLESRSATMPMAWGIFRSSVLMPADAVRWPAERLRIVLLHELAHVKRRDCLMNVVSQIACAIYWFNPLVWVAARHIRTERERACDDLVLAAGTRGPDYAEELLEIARVMRAGRFPALMAGATLAMAHRSQLEGRLMAILDPKLPRAGVSRAATAFAVALVACALPPLATLQAWSIAEEPAVVPIEEAHSGAAPMHVGGAIGSPAQSKPAPTPNTKPDPVPNASPNPNPQPVAGEMGDEIARAIAEAMSATGESIAQSMSESVTANARTAAQSAAQSSVEGALQGVVQSAVALAGQEAAKAMSDPRTVAALTAALKDADKEVREAAMQALVQLRDPAIFDPLVQALKDAAAEVREQAVHGLGQLRDRRAVEPLIGALKDENPGVREQAAFALGHLRDPRAVDPLIGALKDGNASVREQAAFALGQLRDKRAAPALSTLIKDADPDVREQAVFALGQLRDVAAIDGLMAAMRDAKPDVREQAAFALGQIRDGRAVEPLVSALKDENADVRQQAAFALGQIHDKAAVEALVIAVKDPSPDVREQVVFALGQLRDARAIDALTAALKDSSADVRQQAAFALGQLAR